MSSHRQRLADGKGKFSGNLTSKVLSIDELHNKRRSLFTSSQWVGFVPKPLRAKSIKLSETLDILAHFSPLSSCPNR